MRIIFSDLWTLSNEVLTKTYEVARLPITELRMVDTVKIRGRLSIFTNGDELPVYTYEQDGHMIDGWLYWLTRTYNILESGGRSVDINIGLQGCPDYLFEREGDLLYISINESELDGSKNEEWQRVPMSYESFRSGILGFRRDLYEELKKQAPEGYRLYFKNDLPLEE